MIHEHLTETKVVCFIILSRDLSIDFLKKILETLFFHENTLSNLHGDEIFFNFVSLK